MQEFWKFLLDGMSGWIIYVLTLLIGGGLVFRHVMKRRSRQINLNASGDVAGGDIHSGASKPMHPPKQSRSSSNTVQENITAGGDIAGGNITKDKR